MKGVCGGVKLLSCAHPLPTILYVSRGNNSSLIALCCTQGNVRMMERLINQDTAVLQQELVKPMDDTPYDFTVSHAAHYMCTTSARPAPRLYTSSHVPPRVWPITSTMSATNPPCLSFVLVLTTLPRVLLCCCAVWFLTTFVLRRDCCRKQPNSTGNLLRFALKILPTK